jgi:hypothetical protein
MTNNKVLWSDGARALALFLSQRSITVNAFCEKHGLEYASIHKMLGGSRGSRVTLDTALAIESATGGQVPTRSWSATTRSALKPVATTKRQRNA